MAVYLQYNVNLWTQSSVNLVRDPELEMLYAFKCFPGIIYGTSNLPLMPEKLIYTKTQHTGCK